MKNAIGLLILSATAVSGQIAARQVFLDVPEAARRRHNPLAGDAGASTEGLKIFQQHCAQCHGPAGTGGGVGAIFADNLRLWLKGEPLNKVVIAKTP